MVRCWLVVAALTFVACGRVGFDARGDGGGSIDGDGGGGGDAGNLTGLGAITLPAGGTIIDLAIGPPGTPRYALTNGDVYRSTDGATWSRCGALEGFAIIVDPTGTVYLATYHDFYVSTDECATWQATNAECYPNSLGVANGKFYGLCNGTGGGLRVLAGGTWSAVTTPFDADQLDSFAASADGHEIVIGSDLDGMIRSTDFGVTWQPASTGLLTDHDVGLAIAPTDPTRVYAMEASYDGETSDIACSTDGGMTWTMCYPNGGYNVAVDPTTALHALAAPYNDLISTDDGFQTVLEDVRSGEMDEANVNTIQFTSSGGALVGNDRGVYEAAPGTLTWAAELTGLAAWTVTEIVVAGGNIYIGTYGGVLVSSAGSPYTLSTIGLTGATQAFGLVAIANPDVLIAGGLAVRLSADHGQTWSTLLPLGADDGYYANVATTIGTRVFVGTSTRVQYADPPWTSWTPSVVGVAGEEVLALLARGTALWAGGGNGLFYSTDGGDSFQYVGAVTGQTQALALTADDRVVAGTGDSVWISDPTATTWTQTTLDAGGVYSIAANGTAIVAATDDGVRVTHDDGTTWTTVDGFDALSPVALTFEPSGNLLVGTFGYGVTRIAAP